MKVLSWKTEINADPETVWNILWEKENFTRWTSAFTEGSYYEGELEEGNEILFFAPNYEGMYAVVKVMNPYKEMTFIHQGEIENGEKVEKDWENAFESYYLEQTETGTVLTAKLNCDDEYIEMMNKSFPNALNIVKELSEQA